MASLLSLTMLMVICQYFYYLCRPLKCTQTILRLINMAKAINKRRELREKLQEQGKAVTYDNSEVTRVTLAMNERREAFRRGYRVKDNTSRASAAHVIVM